MVGSKQKNLYTVVFFWCTLSAAALSSSCSDGKIKAEVDAKIEVTTSPNPSVRVGNRTIKPFPDSFPTTAGLFVFKPSSDLDLDTIEGYVIGFPDTLKVEATTEDRFFINNVPPGEHEVFLRAKKKDGNDVAVILEGLKSLNGTKTEIDSSKLASSPGKELAFYVKSTENNGISGVSFEIGGTNFKAQSGVDGLVKFSYLPAGKFDLLAQKDGFRSGRWRRVTVDSVGNEIRLIRRVNSGAELKISGGETTVFSVKNVVTVSPPDLPPSEMPDEMLVSSQPDFSDASWEPLRSSFVWRFNAQGTQRLYVKFRKSTGSVVNSSVSLNSPIAAETIFDAFFNDPVITISGGSSTLSSRTFQIQLTAPIEAVSMILSENAPTSSDIWQPIFQSKTFTASGVGTRILSFKFRDADGFESQVFTATVMIDSVPPTNPSLALPNMSDGFINIAENESGFPLVITGEANSDYKISCGTNCKVVSNSGLKTEYLGKLSASGSSTVLLKANTSGAFSATVTLADEALNISTGSIATGVADLDRPSVVISTQGYTELEFDEFLPLKLIASDTGPSGVQSISGDSGLLTIETADAVNCKKAIRDRSSTEKFALLTECSPGRFRVRAGANFALDNAGNASSASELSTEISVKGSPENKIIIGNWYTTRYNLKGDKTLWGWGKTAHCPSGVEPCFQLLGITSSNYYQENPMKIGESGIWKGVCAGPYQTFGIKIDGTLWAWGMNNTFGVLGTSDLLSSDEPRIIDSTTNWTSCVTNGETSYALKSDGTVWGWGSNSHGQLGNTTTEFFSVPTKLNNESWLSVRTFRHNGSLLLHADGSIWLFGYSGATGKSLPNKISSDSWRRIAAQDFGVAVHGNGTLWRVRPGFSPILQQVGSSSNWNRGSVSTGLGGFSSAVRSDGSLWVWDDSSVDSPTQIGSGFAWKDTQIIAEGTHSLRLTFALRSDDTVWAFGDSNSRSLFLVYGSSGARNDVTFSLHQIDASTNWSTVESAGEHTLALKTDGSLWAWGNNSCGQVGNGTNTSALVPVKIGTDSDWAKINTSRNHSVALKTDGTLWAWGCNEKGQLGIGSTNDALAPTQVGSDSDWAEVSAGAGFTIARKTNGTLWAWGDNEFGVVGNGLYGAGQTILAPSQIQTETTWREVFASKSKATAFAMKVNGTLWSWGDGSGNALGNYDPAYSAGGVISHYYPVQVNSSTDWSKLSSSGNGDRFALATKANGTLWGWGYNNAWNLTSEVAQTAFSQPVQIGSANDWLEISAGQTHSIALKNDKRLWGWAGGSWGELGPVHNQGSTIKTPRLISTASDWKAIAAGYLTTFAIKENGTLWGTGRRDFLGMENSSIRTWLQFPTEYE